MHLSSTVPFQHIFIFYASLHDSTALWSVFSWNYKSRELRILYLWPYLFLSLFRIASRTSFLLVPVTQHYPWEAGSSITILSQSSHLPAKLEFTRWVRSLHERLLEDLNKHANEQRDRPDIRNLESPGDIFNANVKVGWWLTNLPGEFWFSDMLSLFQVCQMTALLLSPPSFYWQIPLTDPKKIFCVTGKWTDRKFFSYNILYHG